jgi:hypothetical protein
MYLAHGQGNPLLGRLPRKHAHFGERREVAGKISTTRAGPMDRSAPTSWSRKSTPTSRGRFITEPHPSAMKLYKSFDDALVAGDDDRQPGADDDQYDCGDQPEPVDDHAVPVIVILAVALVPSDALDQ